MPHVQGTVGLAATLCVVVFFKCTQINFTSLEYNVDKVDTFELSGLIMTSRGR